MGKVAGPKNDKNVNEQITDSERIDALERFALREPLLLHGGISGILYSGLGFGPGMRTLREALDVLVKAEKGRKHA